MPPADNGPLRELPPPGERRRLREAMGLSRAQAAKEIGVTKNTLLRWEQGKPMTPANHRKYQQALARWQNLVNSLISVPR